MLIPSQQSGASCRLPLWVQEPKALGHVALLLPGDWKGATLEVEQPGKGCAYGGEGGGGVGVSAEAGVASPATPPGRSPGATFACVFVVLAGKETLMCRMDASELGTALSLLPRWTRQRVHDCRHSELCNHFISPVSTI